MRQIGRFERETERRDGKEKLHASLFDLIVARDGNQYDLLVREG